MGDVSGGGTLIATGPVGVLAATGAVEVLTTGIEGCGTLTTGEALGVEVGPPLPAEEKPDEPLPEIVDGRLLDVVVVPTGVVGVVAGGMLGGVVVPTGVVGVVAGGMLGGVAAPPLGGVVGGVGGVVAPPLGAEGSLPWAEVEAPGEVEAGVVEV